MSQRMSRVAPSFGALSLLLAQAVAAHAQGWNPVGGDCPSCNAAPVSCCAAPPVTCMQPVSVPCYQTVPVTTYEPHHCTVMKPVVHTEIIEQPVTECRPVCEQRTAQIPTCTYQPVTEFVQQTRDAGCWRTYYQCTPRCSPCQYDPNPGLIGWMNRTGYEMRMAFTPPVQPHRQWVPNYITTSVPVTRMVAQQSVRTVTYNVTRMEQFHTVQKVPISRVVMVPEDITVQRPVTVYRTIPIGTSVAWVPSGSLVGGTATALGPTPDRIGRRDPLRAAEKFGEKIGRKEGYEAGKEHEKDKFQREEEKLNLNETTPGDLNRKSDIVIPPRKTGDSTNAQVSQRVPSAVLVNGWMARNRATNGEAPNTSATVSVADAEK
jgi:hypothetical protein